MKSAPIPVRLQRVLRQQPLYLVTASGVAAIFWAITGSAPSLAVTLIYSFALGNLTAVTLESIPTPKAVRNWNACLLFHAGILLMAAPAIVFVATALVVFAAHPEPEGFWVYLATGWKFPLVATLIFGIGYLLYDRTRTRLEEQKSELLRTITLDRAERELDARDLEQAREIQRNLLPKHIPQISGFEIAGVWEPAKVVGGDYFDVIRLSDAKLAICIGDVAGKGISAALLMANVQAAVRAFASDSARPSEVCRRLNSVLCTNLAAGKFVTFFYAVLDAGTRSLQYCNAGHLSPVVITLDGEWTHLENTGALLGVFPDWKYRDSNLQLKQGDSLVLFTDGITEATSDDGEEFGEERIAGAVRSPQRLSAAELQSRLLQSVKEFCNSAMRDDATLLVVSATDPALSAIALGSLVEFSYSGVQND